MKRIGLIVSLTALAAALVVPAGASALSPTDYKNAAAFCRAVRAEMNTPAAPHAFQDTYGTNKNKRNAFGKCVSATVRLVHNTNANAARECKDERATDPATFEQNYGSKKNAFGKCVSSKRKAAKDELVSAFSQAADDCRALRKADPDQFRQDYGTNHNKRNALGKCVSAKVHEQQNQT
jgi:hypothetical protein